MSYFESRLRLNLKNFKAIQQKLNFCQDLGIKNLILEFENGVKNITPELKDKISKFSTIKLYYRTTIRPKNLDDLKKKLKQANNFSGITSVESPDRKTQIQAAKDSRVDIVSFSDENIIKTIIIVPIFVEINMIIFLFSSHILINNKIKFYGNRVDIMHYNQSDTIFKTSKK